MWDIPTPGIKHLSPALAGGFFTTGPPGKPKDVFLSLILICWDFPGLFFSSHVPDLTVPPTVSPQCLVLKGSTLDSLLCDFCNYLFIVSVSSMVPWPPRGQELSLPHLYISSFTLRIYHIRPLEWLLNGHPSLGIKSNNSEILRVFFLMRAPDWQSRDPGSATDQLWTLDASLNL